MKDNKRRYYFYREEALKIFDAGIELGLHLAVDSSDLVQLEHFDNFIEKTFENFQVITLENFRSFIGEEVNIEIGLQHATFIFPKINYLVSYIEGYWYFKSPDKVTTAEEIWNFKAVGKDYIHITTKGI